jgi:basic membrane lipoprotein Med (substrate-binding protein (PBP1-ABC) superfamily)
MNRTPLQTAALSIAAVAILAGCGAGSSTSSSASSSAATASKVSFCQDNATLDRATASAKTGAELVKDLTANQSTITHFGRVAPADVTERAQVLVLGADAAIKSNNGDAFATARFVSVSNAINAYCSQKADGSPASPVT